VAAAVAITTLCGVVHGCARPGSDGKRADEGVSLAPRPSATVNLAPELARSAPRPMAPPSIELPQVTPDLPVQLLVCDRKGFGRLTQNAFEYYSADDLRRIVRLEIPHTYNVVSLMGDTTLIVAREHLHRYYHGQTVAVPFARIPLLGPLQLWPDARDIDSFWVRYLRDPELHHFTLVAKDASVTTSETKPLPGFDGRRFVLLDDGAPFYSSGEELVYGAPTRARRVPLSRFSNSVAGLLASSRLDRVWLLSEGDARLVEFSRGLPEVRRLKLQGTPVGFSRGKSLAVVSATQGGVEAGHWLEVFDDEGRSFVVQLPKLEPTAAGEVLREVDNRAVCVFAERPWVLVGGRQLLQLFDYQSGQMLMQRLPQ
jgi:hypothetical protein